MKLKDALSILYSEDATIPPELAKIMQEMRNSRKSAAIFLAKYCKTGVDDELLETTKEEVWRRLALNLTQEVEVQNKIFTMLNNGEVVPGGRITSAIGGDGRVTAFNCYVGTPPDDTLEGIFNTLLEMVLTFSHGGGFGFDVSKLRPKGAQVNNAARSSTGAASFIDIFSKATGTIGQHNRRGALMVTMGVDHPDIFDFINLKQYDRCSIDDSIAKYVRGENSFQDLKDAISPTFSVNHANLSVRLTDKFMKAVEKDSDFELKWSGEIHGEQKMVTRTIKAKALWENIIKNAWSTAEPGLLFWDKMVSEHNGEYYAPLSSTNPCAEEPLPVHGNCNLAHVNLSALVSDPFTPKAALNYERLRELVRDTVKFLDLVVDYNVGKQAVKGQDEATLRDRRIGVGITGLGDMLFKLGVAYGSKQSKKIVKEIMFTLAHSAYTASMEMSKELGPFPQFKFDEFTKSGYMQRLLDEVSKFGDKDFEKNLKKYGVRNVTLLTVAPVGTGSEILGGVSSGIEPIFAPSFTRRVKFSDGDREFTEYVSVIKDYMRATGSTNYPEYLITAHDLSPELRVEMQSIVQSYIDAAVSSTINLPSTATIDDVSKIYLQAWKAGLKGITVYREGSREGVLKTGKEESRSLIRKLFKHSKDMITPRPAVLNGRVYAIKYCPTHKARISIAGDPITGEPVEISIVTKKPEDEPQAKQLSILLTALLRRDAAHGVSSHWVIDELMDIIALPGAFSEDITTGKHAFISGLSQAAAFALKFFLASVESSEGVTEASKPKTLLAEGAYEYSLCPRCKNLAVIKENGCDRCVSCGDSKC
jgi:ribonucleoside-diphosphate reductase alpha chain